MQKTVEKVSSVIQLFLSFTTQKKTAIVWIGNVIYWSETMYAWKQACFFLKKKVDYFFIALTLSAKAVLMWKISKALLSNLCHLSVLLSTFSPLHLIWDMFYFIYFFAARKLPLQCQQVLWFTRYSKAVLSLSLPVGHSQRCSQY